MSDPAETQGTTNAVCPHCGYEDRDSWEINFGPGLEGETTEECGNCCESFIVCREVSVTYSTRKVKP